MDPPSSDAQGGCRRDSSGWPPASRIAWGEAGGGSPRRRVAEAAADIANHECHIGDVRADGVVEDDGDDDDLDNEDDKNNDDEGEDKNGNEDNDAVVSGEAAAAAASTTRRGRQWHQRRR